MKSPLSMGNKVKTISVYRKSIFDAGKPGERTEAEPVIVSTTEFHPQWGKPVMEVQYSQEGDMEQQARYEYDANGFLIREVLTEGHGEVLEEKSFEPDDQLRIKKEFRHYADGSFDTLEYWYDDAGHVVRKDLYDDEGVLESKEVFEYRDGLLVKEMTFEGDDELLAETEYTYDDDGLLDEKIIHQIDEGHYVRQEFSYNESGVRDAILGYNREGDLVERILFTLDDKGRPVSIEEENKRKKNQIRLAYDDADLLVFQEEFDMKGELVSRVSRNYDTNGLLLSSEVTARNPLLGQRQHYEVIHRYEFFEE